METVKTNTDREAGLDYDDANEPADSRYADRNRNMLETIAICPEW
jgi:hypothetical protein